MSSRPGPTNTESAASKSGSSFSSPASPTEPPADWGSPITPASGSVTAGWTATESATARVTRPAPARSAAVPASSAAPGVRRPPPITNTAPREYLSAPAEGRGQSRSSDGVIGVDVIRSDEADLARVDTGVPGMFGHLDALPG